MPYILESFKLADRSGMDTCKLGRVIMLSVVTTVVKLTEPIEAYSVVPYGQSLKPTSIHYSDQMPLYPEAQMRPTWHFWDQLQGHIELTETVAYVSSN